MCKSERLSLMAVYAEMPLSAVQAVPAAVLRKVQGERLSLCAPLCPLTASRLSRVRRSAAARTTADPDETLLHCRTAYMLNFMCRGRGVARCFCVFCF